MDLFDKPFTDKASVGRTFSMANKDGSHFHKAYGHRRMHSCPSVPYQFGSISISVTPSRSPSVKRHRRLPSAHLPGSNYSNNGMVIISAVNAIKRPSTTCTDEDEFKEKDETDDFSMRTVFVDSSLTRCGWFCYKPQCLQPLASPRLFLLAVVMLYFVQSFIVSGYINSINTTIELKYGLSTREIGYIYASYEVTCIFATFFISYLGHSLNRARLLGLGCIIIGLGYFFFAFPHFLGNAISNSQDILGANASAQTGLVCLVPGANSSGVVTPLCEVQNSALLIFCLSYALVGLGASPVYILAPTYLWDNVAFGSYPLYAACLHISSALGPAFGFLGGGYFLSLYVNYPYPSTSSLTSSHPLWAGAWWLGFLIFSVLAVIVAVPLLGFPTILPKSPASFTEVQVVKKPEVSSQNDKSGSLNSADSYVSQDSSSSSVQTPRSVKIRDIPSGLKRLFTNPIWLFISMLNVSEQSVVQAFVAYVNKYMQKSFGLPASQSSIITGLLVIPSAVIGILVGAFIMRRFQPTIRSTSVILIVLCVSTTILTTGLVLCTCNNVSLYGLTRPYGFTPTTSYHLNTSTLAIFSANKDLNSTCNMNCACNNYRYDPVCDTNTQISYFSPCHAGCRNKTALTSGSTESWNFTQCSCSPNSNITHSVVSGKCASSCTTFIPFCVLLFLIVGLTACGYEPSHIVTLSSVGENESSFALGIQNVLQRMLAFIPAPIYFGSLFDSTCLLWAGDSACDKGSGQGVASACMEYDLTRLPYMWIGVICGLKLLGLMFCALVYISSRSSKEASITMTVSTDPSVKSSNKSSNTSPAPNANGSASVQLHSISPKPT